MSVILIISVMLMCFGSINVFATTTTQDGLEATLTTDKSNYGKDDKISVTVAVKNTNADSVENVSLEAVVPNGYTIADNLSKAKNVGILKSGETSTLEISYIPVKENGTEKNIVVNTISANTVNTGDTLETIFVIIALLVVSGGLIAFLMKNKKAKAFLSLLLVVSILGSSSVVLSFKTYAVEFTQKIIEVKDNIKVNERILSLSSKIKYDYNKTEKYYTVTFNSNGGSSISNQLVQEGQFATIPNMPTKDGFIFVGWYTSEDLTNRYNFLKNPVTSDITLWAKWNEVNSEIDENADSDSDGLPDRVEVKLGTDITKEDTDGDGLSDYFEAISTWTDPLSIDTDGNCIGDEKEDFDKDGLNNLEEATFKTNPYISDTDKDGLSDSEEVKKYNTNPIIADTDGDGVSDGKEIEIGTNPLVAETSFEINEKSTDEDTVSVSVKTTLSGNQVETLKIEKYNNEYFFPESMPGYIGGAYDFYVDGSFNSATIQFEFDESLLDDDNFEPVIYYFNEEKQLLEELDTKLTGNIASTTVTHFSKYILLNRKVYQDSFEWQDVWDSTGYSNVEVVLVIDDSGSMTGNDRSNQRLEVAQNLIDKLPENNKIGVVSFTYDTSILTSTLTEEKDIAKSLLTKHYFHSSGGTRMYTAVEQSFSLFESNSEDTLKMMVVLSDGETGDTSKHSSVISYANENNIKIYTVGLGKSSSEYFTNYLKPLANNTAAAFYLASDASELQNIYDDINKKIDIETDSDGDGIADYYEEHMVMFNGITIKLDKNNPDSDGDGLLDGEEVAELNYQYNSDRTQVIVTGKLLANPLEMDTDGDGISDEEEMVIGTNPTLEDTDGDGLSDGIELANLFDPLDKNPDGDGKLDLQEYNEGTDPFVYDKEWYEHLGDFVYGFILGDFIKDTDSLPTIIGQITSSFIPFVDARDVVGNLVNGDYLFAGLSVIGLVPALGDATKTAGKVGKFIVKNVDDVPKIASLLEFLNKNLPDVVKVLNKSDDFVDAAKSLSKADNIKLTRKQMQVIIKAFDDAGLSHYLTKTSSKLTLKESINVGSETWLKKALVRGKDIDNIANGHKTGKGVLKGIGLGENFPVVDRIIKDERKLVSTKSLDIGSYTYQDTNKLKSMLNKYKSSLENFENGLKKGGKPYFDSQGVMEWGGTKLLKTDYDKKVLEIILPDVIITDDVVEVLNDFQKTSGDIEVWYRIGK